MKEKTKEELIDDLTRNTISHENLNRLMNYINADDLKSIVLRIFDAEEKDILQKSMVEGALKTLNTFKNSQRNEKYFTKIKESNPKQKFIKIIAEGDSWFNYPIILSDIIDWISMESGIAVYSLAAGGDWLLNILATREYVDGLSVHRPDFFLMSGGGNDVGGMNRIALMVNTVPSQEKDSEFDKNEWAKKIIEEAKNQPNQERWARAIPYLSKDLFALLMLFRLQYFSLFNDILVRGKEKYPTLKIITQGYDYLIPSLEKGYGTKPLNWYIPVLRNIGHGKWLKTPLLIREIYDEQLQKDIIYAIIFLFNEMMIELEEYFMKNILKENDRIFHIDSRGLVSEDEWTDEIHPKPDKFRIIANTYLDCINGKKADFKNVYVSKNRQN